MPNNRSFSHGAVRNPETMPERLALITELLQDTREAQDKGNSMLADLRVEVAALQRSHDGQGQHIADMRADLRQMSDRLRDAELQMQRIPHAEASLGRAHGRLDEHERRLRALEGDGRENKVVSRSIMGWGADLRRYVVGALGSALVAAALWMVKYGGQAN